MTHPATSPLEASLAWLKRVSGVDDSYLSRWPDTDWQRWANALHADPTAPCPEHPAWLQTLVPQGWNTDFSATWPIVGQLMPTAHDWFAEADTHEDFSLDTPEGPELSRVRQAWNLALEAGAQPLVNLCLVPDGVQAIKGEIEAFYLLAGADQVAVPAETTFAVAEALGLAGQPWAHAQHAPVEARVRAGLPRHADEQIVAWEWLYGWLSPVVGKRPASRPGKSIEEHTRCLG